MSFALRVYNRLPARSRTVVATTRGFYLNWWRYGRDTERLVEEALERDHWSDAQWTEWQAEKLAFVLERAARKVPFYRAMWDERRRRGDRSSWQYLENWPVLEKTELRKHPRAFVADDCSPSRMFHDHTSGTTGTSLDLWSSARTVRYWYALFEARCRRWYGLSRHDRWAILGGQLVTPAEQSAPPFWVWNGAMNQLYLSSYHLSPKLIPHYLDAIGKYRIKYILGYPSAIYSLALGALEQKRQDHRLTAAITNAEPLYEYQRAAIEEAFSCPVRETYGMAETVAAASECEHGSLHRWPEAGIIETVDPQNGDRASGDFVCTSLLNTDMPLIRYRVGDSGSIFDENCTCGRSLPLIKSIEGRSDDVLFTRDGTRVGRLDPVFKSSLPIVEAQIIQESLTTINVRYVPAANFSSDVLPSLAERIRERMGEVAVTFDAVDEIPRTSRGKFRAVICKLTDSERAALTAQLELVNQE
jgi:phenylacetate-CoA ligase